MQDDPNYKSQGILQCFCDEMATQGNSMSQEYSSADGDDSQPICYSY